MCLMNRNISWIRMSYALGIMLGKQVLVRWLDRPEEDSTWENVSTLKKQYPDFVFEDESIFPRGGNVRTQVP